MHFVINQLHIIRFIQTGRLTLTFSKLIELTFPARWASYNLASLKSYKVLSGKLHIFKFIHNHLLNYKSICNITEDYNHTYCLR